MAQTHRCPADGCRTMVKNTMAFCHQHWWRVPSDYRRKIYRSYNKGESGTGDHIELIAEAALAILPAKQGAKA